LILGHSNKDVVETVKKQFGKGVLFGTPTENEVKVSKLIRKAVPCAAKIRLVNTGTEASMHAVRVARGFTKRNKVVKFEGAFHGSVDSLLVKAGSGASAMGVPSSEGVPASLTTDTIVIPFNDKDSFEHIMDKHASEIAAVLAEPVMGNAGPILPRNGFLQYLRKKTAENGIVLIFDEVITGFRIALGGAQEYYGVIPDMAMLGKILGGGFPIAAYVGRREIMDQIAPSGNVYQAGTFSGNPISVSAAIATLKILIEKRHSIYRHLANVGEQLSRAISDIAHDFKIAAQVCNIGSMFQIFFTETEVIDYKTALISDRTRFLHYQTELLRKGIFVPPSQFETCFLSTAHNDRDIALTLKGVESSLKAISINTHS
ncbi:MAG: aspartate aminotransferase family protein, partial [Candidatus Bathyarchaeia archaeon]